MGGQSRQNNQLSGRGGSSQGKRTGSADSWKSAENGLEFEWSGTGMHEADSLVNAAAVVTSESEGGFKTCDDISDGFKAASGSAMKKKQRK